MTPLSSPTASVDPRPAVLVVGSYVQDQAWFVEDFPRPGETVRAHQYNTGPGGKGFNQAIACLRQGVPTAFVGALGRDPFARFAQDFAAAERMPCRWQISEDRPTATSSIVVNARAENQIAMIFGANERLAPAFVLAQEDLFAGARVLLIQLECNLEALGMALELARAYRLLRILNPAPVHAELPIALLRSVDILTPNETEFSSLLERFADVHIAPERLAASDDATLHDYARRLTDATVVVTLGSRGCFVSHGEAQRGDLQACYRLPPEKCTPIDTTGAGDAFSGALAAGLVHFAGEPFRTAAVHANRAAALSTEIVGTAPAMPTFAAVQARFGA
jgi:ribokinase